MNEHRISNSNIDDLLGKAELRKMESEVARNEAEQRKLESENLEISNRLRQPWWSIRFATLIQATIAGIVGGALFWGFALEHFIKISNINEMAQMEIKIENTAIKKENKKIEEQHLKNIDNYQAKVQALKEKTEALAKTNASLASQVNASVTLLSERLERTREKLKEIERLKPPSKAKADLLAREKTKTRDQIGALEEKIHLLGSESKALETRSRSIEKDVALLSKYTALVFYRRQQQSNAKQIENSLLESGYQTSSIPTDFSELSKPHPSGTIYVSYSERGKKVIKEIKKELESMNLEGSLVIPEKTIKLKRGDIQIFLF